MINNTVNIVKIMQRAENSAENGHFSGKSFRASEKTIDFSFASQ
jgi:hypothetical protein